jgi:uracil-DNA glycosylase family 4
MSVISKRKVNPSGPEDAEILIVGEAPGDDDNLHGKPFTGRSGELLNHFLSLVGINRDLCRLTNVSCYQPKAGQFHLLHGSKELMEGYAELTTYLQKHNPKVIIPLGSEALKFFTGQASITKWRGTVLKYGKSLLVPTINPAMAFRDGQAAAIIEFDLRKAKRVLDVGYTNPTHNFDTSFQCSNWPSIIPAIKAAPYISVDIESVRGTNHVLCVGIAVDKSTAFCLRNSYPLNSGIAPDLLDALLNILPAAKSVTFHNGLFDTEVLGHHGIHIPNYDYDTMYAQRVIACELPIGLDFCTSIYTDEPYYKDEGKDNSSNYKQTLWEYNCKDCITTWEVRQKQEEIFAGDKYLSDTFKYQMSIVPVAKHLQESGLLIDEERIKFLRDAVQDRLDKQTSFIYAIAKKPILLSSPKQVTEFLYKNLELPTRTNQDGNTTTSEDALVSLIQYCQKEMETKKTEEARQRWFFKLSALKLLLMVRGDEKLISSYLNVKTSPDGRVRSSYKISGTETGRWSCSNYIDGTGLNAQTLPRGIVEL